MDGSSFLAAFASAGSADGQKSTLNSKSPNNEEVIHFNGLLDSFPVKGKQVNPIQIWRQRLFNLNMYFPYDEFH